MSEVVLKDHSIHEPTTAHIHPLETIPQGTQADGVLNGHEHGDANTSTVYKVAVGLVALIVFSFVAMTIMTKGMLGALKHRDSLPSSTYVERPALARAWPVKPIDTPLQSPTSMPVLQADPELPNVELREEDEAQLYNYNEAKDAQGRKVGYKIPVDRAMDLTLERGLPTDNRTQAKLPKPSGDVVAMGAISFSQKYLRDYERSKLKKGAKPEVGSQTNGMRSRDINPNAATNSAFSSKMDEDGRTLGMKRSPY